MTGWPRGTSPNSTVVHATLYPHRNHARPRTPRRICSRTRPPISPKDPQGLSRCPPQVPTPRGRVPREGHPAPQGPMREEPGDVGASRTSSRRRPGIFSRRNFCRHQFFGIYLHAAEDQHAAPAYAHPVTNRVHRFPSPQGWRSRFVTRSSSASFPPASGASRPRSTEYARCVSMAASDDTVHHALQHRRHFRRTGHTDRC